METIFAQQGELIIRRAEYLGELPVTKESTIVGGGSGGTPHRLPKGIGYRRSGAEQHVRVLGETPVLLTHDDPEGHPDVPLAPGDYTITVQIERFGATDAEVQD